LLLKGAKRLGGRGTITIDPDVEEILSAYDWPGNVREMENVVDRALILADEGRITREDLPPQILRSTPAVKDGMALPDSGDSLREQVRRFEASIINKAIMDASGDRRAAAQKLGIGLSSLYRKLEEYEALGLVQENGDKASRPA